MKKTQTKTDLAYEINKFGGLPYLLLMTLTKVELIEIYNEVVKKDKK